MKSSKLLLTSLLAAAATLSVPAYADLLGNVTYTGGRDILQGTMLGAYTTSESITTGTTTTSTNFVSSVPVGGNFWPGAYTMMFWIDFGSNTISSNSVIFEYGGGDNTKDTEPLGSNALVISSAGELIFGRGKYTNNTSYAFQDANKVTTSSLGLTSGVHHIAVTSAGTSGDRNIFKIYVDGVEQTLYAADGTKPDSDVNLNMNGNQASFVSSTEVLATDIGLNYGDAMLYGGALSQQEIQKVATHTIYDLTWNGEESNNWNTTDANWTRAGAEGSVAFGIIDNVTFAGDATVTVSESITASSVSVTGGNVSFSGSGSIFSTNGVTVSGSGVLSIAKYENGSKSIIHGKLLIENGGKVKLTDGDATGYNGGSNAINALVINEGGELIIETNSYTGKNQTFNMSGGITLQGGKISGTNAEGYSKFDLFNSNTGITTLASSTTAEIQASIGLRQNGTFDVAAGTTADGVDLLVSGRLTSKGMFGSNANNNESFSTTLRKIGAGTMKLTGDNQYWTTGGTVEAGKLVAASANALGTGSITVSETGETGAVLEVAVADGTLRQADGQSLTTTGAGKITVSAGTLALTGAVNLSNAIEVADGATVTTTEDVMFSLANLTGTTSGNVTTYSLVSLLGESQTLGSDWTRLDKTRVDILGSSIAARDWSASFVNDGSVVITSNAGELTWVGDENGAGTWNYAAENKPWTMSGADTAFVYNDNVTFDKNASVEVDAAGVTAGTVTIASDKTVTLTGGNLTVSDRIVLESGSSTLALGAGSTNNAVSGSGTVAVVGNVKDFFGNSAQSTISLRDAGEDAKFTGTVELRGVQAIVSGTNASTFGSASKIVLNSAALHFNNAAADFTKDIEIKDGQNGYIRSYGNNKIADGLGATISGNVSGTGTLTSSDDGDVTFTGTVNIGAYVGNKSRGISVFKGDSTTIGTLTVNSGVTAKFTGAATEITTANVAGNANFTGSATLGTLTVNSGATAEFTGTTTGITTANVAGNTNFTGSATLGALTVTGGTATVANAATADITTATLSGGTTNFNGATTLGTLNVTNGTTNFTGATNITSATVTGGTLNFTISTLNDAQSFTSATDISVSGGTVWFGEDTKTLSSASFGENIALTVSGSGTARFAISQGNNKIFSGALKLENGGTYSKHDGGVELAGNVTLGEADSDVVSLTGNWAKGGTKISGTLSGAGTAYFGSEGQKDTGAGSEILTISGEGNSYSGEIVVGKINATTESGDNSTELVLSTETALQYGKVNLAGSSETKFAQLTLGANAVTIAGLSGTGFGKVALGSGVSFSTLTLNQTANTTFAGTIADGIALKKAGAGTLTLSGDNAANTNGVTISGGKLIAAHARALGTGKTTVESGAKLGLVARTAVTVTNGIDLARGAKIVVDMTGVVAGAEDDIVLTLVSETALNYNGTGLFDTTGMLGSVVVLENLSETLSAWTQSLSYSGNTLQLTLTIPEPSVFGLLAGLGALALAGTRRRRKKA